MTFKFKTHNPIFTILLFFLVAIISICLKSNKYDNGIDIVIFFAFYPVSFIINYYLFADKITATVNENGITTNWMIAPYYLKLKKEIMWNEIESWDFERTKAYEVLTIKTKDKKTFSIRCLNFKTQPQLYEFLDQVIYEIELYNNQQLNSIYEIKNNQIFKPKVFYTTFIIAIAITIIVLLLVYSLT